MASYEVRRARALRAVDAALTATRELHEGKPVGGCLDVLRGGEEMDPNRVLADFYEAHAAAERASVDADSDELDHLREAADCAHALFDWLEKGGFAPDWSKKS